MLSVSHGSNVINFRPQKRFDVVRVLATAPKGSEVKFITTENYSAEELIQSWKKTAKKFGYTVSVAGDETALILSFKEIK